MRALVIERFGPPEVLKTLTVPDPRPGPGELCIRVERAGLNFADLSARVGLYPDAPKPPMTVGYEVAGTVDTLGEGTAGFSVGQRVLAFTRFSGQAERVCVPQSLALELPPEMSFEVGAALPVAYLTAYHALFHVAQVRPGARVLLHAAAGGVGLAAIQLCRTVPNVELFGTASQGKHELLRKMGLDHPIDYHQVDYADEVRRLTQGKGVHLVLDPLGGPDWHKGYQLLAPTGQLVAFGWSNMMPGQRRNFLHVGSQLARMRWYSPAHLMNDNRTVSGINMGHLWAEQELLRGHLLRLLELWREGKLAPHVDKVFPLSQGPEAHRYLQERRNVGKVLFDCTA